MRIKNNIIKFDGKNNDKKDKNISISERLSNIRYKKEKIQENNFEIPNYSEYEKFLSNDYRVSFLKEICKYYKIKVSGNKPILVDRIYNHLLHSYSVIKIQKFTKKILIKRYNSLFGIAFINRKLCKNDTDFFTLEDIKKIPYNNFISYKDDAGNIWGFDIKSLYGLFTKNNLDAYSPYTRDKIDINIFNDLKLIIKLSKIFNYNLDLKINDDDKKISQKKQIEFKCLELFQHIDQLGNYTDIRWFLSLNKNKLIKFIREIVDIWEYRASLSDLTKREICYPSGNPFRNININNLQELSFISLQKITLIIIEELVKKSVDTDNAILGASYVLCAFTLTNADAANALPWLYQSVVNI